MRAIGWNLGQRGDIIMNTVVARGFKEEHPNSHLTLGIYKAFADMKDLFKNHPYIDDVHTYDSYEDWPSNKDLDFLQSSGFDKVFHGMPNHSRSDWYNYCSCQTEESCLMNGIKPPKDLQCNLTKWFDINDQYSNFICIAPFSSAEKKDLSIEKANKIVEMIQKNGYNVLQLSSDNQPKLKNAIYIKSNYMQSVINMLSCRMLITVNTGMAWTASAYSHKTLGIYGIDRWGYPGLKSSKVYEPINPNAKYLSAEYSNDIHVEIIEENFLKLLNI